MRRHGKTTRTGYRLGTFRNGVLGKLTREDEADSSLNLARRDCRLLGVRSKFCDASEKAERWKRLRTGCLSGNALENVVDKRVEDGHGLVGDTGIGVDLLEDCCELDKWQFDRK